MVEVVKTNTEGCDFPSVVSSYFSDVAKKKVGSACTGTEIARHTLKSYAACIGATAAVASVGSRDEAVATFIGNLGMQNSGQPAQLYDYANPEASERGGVNSGGSCSCDLLHVGTVVLSLRSIGEVGALADLSGSVSMPCLDESMDRQTSLDIRHAAVSCAANVSIGNLSGFVPQLVRACSTVGHDKSGAQANMMAALTELLTSIDRTALDEATTGSILDMLLSNAESEKADVRMRVGECLGSFMTDSATIEKLQKMLLETTDTTRRVTIINAARDSLKFGTSFELAPFISLLETYDGDADKVNEACLLLLAAALRHQPAMTASISDQIIPAAAYAHSRFFAHKVQVVDLGGMKITVDRGEGVRKAAFEFLETFVNSEVVEDTLPQFVDALAGGLQKHSVTLVTLYWTIGNPEIVKAVCMANGEPGAGTAEFVALRSAEIAAAIGVSVVAIEVDDVKRNQTKLKAAHVAEFAFYIRCPDSKEKIAALREQVEGGGFAGPVPLHLYNEQLKEGGVKLMELEVSIACSCPTA